VSDRKTLLPELLPDPRPRPRQGPRERVAARARVMLDRLASLKTAAGAAVLAVHCGYGVVDPLPPPPSQCTTINDPFGRLYISGFSVPADGGGSSASFTIATSTAVGYDVGAVRVTAGGTLIGVVNESPPNSSGSPPTDFTIAIMPDGSGAPILFEVDLRCGDATATKHYEATLYRITYTVLDLD